jgi:hypothetical protein
MQNMVIDYTVAFNSAQNRFEHPFLGELCDKRLYILDRTADFTARIIGALPLKIEVQNTEKNESLKVKRRLKVWRFWRQQKVLSQRGN